jgi:hypothetical protein
LAEDTPARFAELRTAQMPDQHANGCYDQSRAELAERWAGTLKAVDTSIDQSKFYKPPEWWRDFLRMNDRLLISVIVPPTM